jgi:competence protein ComEC
MRDTPIIPIAGEADTNPEAAPQRAAPWQSGGRLSSRAWRHAKYEAAANSAENFLVKAGFDKAPWLAVVFISGIFAWFALPVAWQWVAAMAGGVSFALTAVTIWPLGSAADENRSNLRQALMACGLVFTAGIAVVWARSEIVGAPPIARPMIEQIEGYVLEREDQPAEGRVRLTLGARDPATGAALKIRVNVPTAQLAEVDSDIIEGAVIRLRARLMPPAPPMLPGGYDFARAAWFKGLAATGSALGPVTVITDAPQTGDVRSLQRALSAHVRERVAGSAGSIAAAFASGDRGAIDERDDTAMRDAGLTHLLSISGLHVSAVIAAAYLLAIRLLALVPMLALRVRLPVVAAACGALAGLGYTLLTGAEVPTVRACAAAMLVLLALAIGRDALSMRMVAVAAGFVLLLWPESAIGPSFQMSFSAVLAIVALSSSAPVRAFMAPREEAWVLRIGRKAAMLLVTGFVIELALMPIVLFHFHRAGLYGAFANLIAIPLVTFVAMPLIALALLLDLAGWGAPVWWLVQGSLDVLLALAHFTAAQPGAVKLMPQMSHATIGVFTVGALWLALWQGRPRLLGLVPIALTVVMLIATPIPDILISRDGRQVGIIIEQSGERHLLSLRDSNSSYTRDNLLELAGVASAPIPITNWPDATCSSAFCLITITREAREWRILMARNRIRIEERALAAACAQSDIVIAERYLPYSCRPRWLKADRRMLDETGGLAINLDSQRIHTVAAHQGQHGWWQARSKARLPRPPAQ